MTRIDVPQNEYTEPIQERAVAGSVAVIDYIYSLQLDQRVAAAKTAQKVLFANAADVQGLDLYIDTMRTLIEKGTSGLTKVGSSEEDNTQLDAYNAIAFNVAANLADCWPGDELPRESRHFEAGLKAAEDCVRWRNALNKPPRPFSIAYWAKGMHLLSLGYFSGAVKSFNMGLTFAERAAQEAGKSTEIDVDSSFDLLLNHGYLGIGEQLDGDVEGAQRYNRAISLFKQQIVNAQTNGDHQAKDDAEFGIAQLEKVRERYVR